MAEHDVTALQTENARLSRCSSQWHRLALAAGAVASAEVEVSNLSTDQKVALFRRLFQGRTDVFTQAAGKVNDRQGRLRPGLRQ